MIGRSVTTEFARSEEKDPALTWPHPLLARTTFA
jgi:hypothetical protein